MKKIDISKEQLYELYIIQNLNANQIADKLNIGCSTVSKKIKKFGIKKDKKTIIENRIKTNIERYGSKTKPVEEKTIEKREQTCLKRYGVTNPAKLEEVQKKKKQNTLKKHGVDHTSKLKSTTEKRNRTNLFRYGVENISQLKEIQEKKEKTFLKHYGVKNIFQRDDIKKEIKKTHLEKTGFENPMFLEENKIKIAKTNSEKYGVPFFCMTDRCKKANGHTISKINKDFSEKLKFYGIPNKLEKTIDTKSYDIEILNTNIILEINPTYTHNSTLERWFNNHSKQPLDKNYHYEKTIKAKENSYRCIHIFDWDDENKIINILKPKQKVYARNLDCREISQEQCTDFLTKYHLQGSCKGQIVRIGLFKDNNLLEVMTFGKTRYNKNYEWELLRLCSHSDYNIIGGANRLFTHFLIDYKPNSIISYCDNSKFDGNVYKWLDFKLLDYGKPSKHWYNMKTKQHITDNLLRQRGFDQLFKTNYGKGTSNKELMIEHGFVEIYDCGQSVYVYKNIKGF